MAQTGYTPIQLYYSTTAAAVPTNTNLANGELAINITDGKLYYKDNGGTVRLLASNATSAPVLTFSAGTTGFTPSSATSGAVTLAGTLNVVNGGTGQTSYTDGQLLIGNTTGNTLTKATLTAGSGVTITNGAGSITINATGTGGDVVGPASATANGIALFNSTTGKLIKDSAASDGLIYGLTVGRGAGAVATNTAVGASALAANTTAGNNTAVGVNAMALNQDGQRNAAFGNDALSANVSGNFNTAIGDRALNATTASQNTSVGARSLIVNTTGSDNSALGYLALRLNTTGTNNTAIGSSALQANTTASDNTAVGYQAAYSTTIDGENTAVGHTAFYTNTTGNRNVAIGKKALYSNVGADGNTAVGYEAALNNTTAELNSAFGFNAFRTNTTGSNNTALGTSALYSNTTASNNTAVGYQAGYSNTTGGSNTYVGRYAGYTNTVSGNNLCVGDYAGYFSTGADNTFVGARGGSASGEGAGYQMTTGSKNTILGKFGGNQGGLDIRTSDNYIVLSDGDGNPRMYSDNNGVLYDQNGKLRAVPQSGAAKSSSYTLATTDVGEFINVVSGGAIVIPNATFATGDVITIFNNNTATMTITCSITTAYIAGTATDKATMTLAAAGVATILFIDSTSCVVTGNVT